MHARQQIIQAAVTALAGLATTADRVHAGRADPVKPVGAYLLVYARQEQAQPQTIGGPARRLRRQLVLRIEGVSIDTADSDAVLDQIALEVEQAMMVEPTMGGLVKDHYPAATELAVAVDGQSRVARLRLDYVVSYDTPQNDPQTAI